MPRKGARKKGFGPNACGRLALGERGHHRKTSSATCSCRVPAPVSRASKQIALPVRFQRGWRSQRTSPPIYSRMGKLPRVNPYPDFRSKIARHLLPAAAREQTDLLPSPRQMWTSHIFCAILMW